MPLNFQDIPVPFAGGIDTKTDPKQLGPAKLLALQNGVFKNPGKIQKRNGFSLLNANTSVKNVAACGNELLEFTGRSLLARDSAGELYDRGSCYSAKLSRQLLVNKGTHIIQQDAAIYGNMVCVAWEEQDASGVHFVRYQVSDTVTGSILNYGSVLGGASSYGPKVAVFQDCFLIFYARSTSLYAMILTTDDFDASVVTLVGGSLRPTAAYNVPLDVLVAGDQCFFATMTAAGELYACKVFYLDSGFAVSAGAYLDTFPSCSQGVALAFDSSAGVLTVVGSNGASLWAVGVETDLAPYHSLAAFTIDSSAVSGAKHPTFASTVAGTGKVACSLDKTDPDSETYVCYLNLSNWSGANTEHIVARKAAVAGKIFISDGAYYVTVTSFTDNQPTYFLMEVETPYPVARMLGVSASGGGGGGKLLRYIVPEALTIDTEFGFPLIERTSASVYNGVITTNLGISLLRVAFYDALTAYIVEEFGGNLYINGGYLHLYDGDSVTEHGFHLYPEGCSGDTRYATVRFASIQAGDTLTVQGRTFTAGTTFSIGATDTITATNFAQAIFEDAVPVSTGGAIIQAVAVGDTVSLYGFGTSIVVTPSAPTRSVVNYTRTVWGTITVASVAAGDYVVLNGTVFTAVTGTASGNQFVVGASDSDTATSLASAIVGAGLCNGRLYASSAGGVVSLNLFGMDVITFTSSASTLVIAQNVAAQTNRYTYAVVYAWPDNRGQMHRSAPSSLTEIQVACENPISEVNIISLRLPTLNITAKLGVQIEVYRTEANGTRLYRCSTLTATSDYNKTLTNDKSLNYMYFFDRMADSILIGNEYLYTDGGVLENYPGPAFLDMCIWQKRLVGIEAERPLSLWYSHQMREGVPAEFSAFLVQEVDPDGEDTVAIGSLDEKLIAFKNDLAFYFAGQAADQTGANSTLTSATLIASATGCMAQKSLVLTQSGLMRQSQKGIWLLDRALNDSYIGAEIEGEIPSGAKVLSAVQMPDANQIRFLLETKILVFDNLVKQWGIFTIMGVPAGAVIWRKLYVYCNSAGNVYCETPGTFSDNGAWIQLKVKTSWLQFAGVQGFQRVAQVLLLGDWKSKHDLNVKVYTDFSATPDQTLLLENSTSPGDKEQWRVDVKYQKCESLQIELYDAQVTGQPIGEGLSLSGLLFNVGLKPGGFKMPAAASKG